jgi:sugar lactone lactonase YvrE
MVARAQQAIDGVAKPNVMPRRIHSISGFDIPESVLYDEELDIYFVSNVTAHATRKDNTGFISRVRPDGSIEALKFIEGGKGTALHAPKGMAMRADTLWVVDVDSVRAFNKRTGAPISSIDLTSLQPTLPNDIAYAPDGTLYISDTGLQFQEPSGVRWTNVFRIFRRTATGTAEMALQDTAMAGPNGVFWDPVRNGLLIGSLRSTPVLLWRPGERAATVVARGTGGFDGITRSNSGRIFLSSQDGSSIVELINNRLTRLIDNIDSPGDIGYDTRRERVLIPLLGAGRVEVWEVGR